MIAVDSNILIYAHRSDSPYHEGARQRVAALAESGQSWAIPWPCVHEFLAIITHPRIYDPPTPLAAALAQIEAWRESPTLVMIAESDVYWPELKRILLSGHVTGPRIHDARIAVLCLNHGVRELWSADRDFSRFPDLAVVNPLLR